MTTPATPRCSSTGSSLCWRLPSSHAGSVLVDCTLGLGGHTEAVLERLPAGPGHRHRPRPSRAARWPASGSRPSATASPACTRSTTRSPRSSADLGLDHVDAVFFDLGVSSMQLDVRERGFAYAEDAPLDMRMDADHRARPRPTCSTPYSAGELTRILREYGEEKFASKIARAVVRRRETSRSRPAPAWSSCSTPRSRRPRGVRAATRPSAPSRRCGWRSTTSSPCCAARSRPRSRRSGSAAAWSSSPTTRSRTGWSSGPSPTPPASTCPPDLPFVPEGAEPPLRLVTRGAEQADEHEIEQNPRAASVRLRAVERVRPVHPSTSRLPQEPPDEQSRSPDPHPRHPDRARTAVDKARLTVVPRMRTRAPRVPFVTLVSLVLVGGVVGLLLFNTSMQQASFAAASLEDQADTWRPASRRCGWSSTSSATRSGWRPEAQQMGMVIPAAPVFLDLEAGRTSGVRTPATPENAIQPRCRRPPIKPADPRARPDDRRGAGRRPTTDVHGQQRPRRNADGTERETNKQGTQEPRPVTARSRRSAAVHL